jgi:hypothetical protein
MRSGTKTVGEIEDEADERAADQADDADHPPADRPGPG